MLRRFVKLMFSAAVGCADELRNRTRRAGRESSIGVVLYYHAIPAALRSAFARQLDDLCRQGQAWALEAPVPHTGWWVGISFDDAYVSVLENAVPALLARNLPFTVFVPTGSLGQHPGWVHASTHPFRQERVMFREQIVALAELPGVTVGSHTVNHPRLTELPLPVMARELRDSRHMLEDLIGRPVRSLSFPHGAWNLAVVESARAAGYDRLFGIEPVQLANESLPAVIGRVAVEPCDTRLEFRLKLRGCYRWASGRRRTIAAPDYAVT